MWTRSLTRPVSSTVRLSTGDSAGAPGLFRVDADTAPFGLEDATPGSRACVRVRVPPGQVRRAGLPGALWCASPFPVAGLAALFVCSAPSGLGSPFFFSFCAPRLSPAFLVFGPRLPALGVLPPPPFFFLRPPLFFCAPPLSLAFRVFRPGVPWALASSYLPLPPPLFLTAFPRSFCFSSPGVFFSLCAPPLSLAFRVFRPGVPWAFFVFLSPPPPPFSFFFFCFSSVLFFLIPWVFFFAPPLSLAFRLFRPGLPWAWAPCCRPRPPPYCFFLPVCFLLFVFVFFSSFVPCGWCDAALVCVSWAVGCAGVCFGCAVPVVALCAVLSCPSGAGWCCVVLPVVFECLLLGLAVLRCVLVGPGVVFGWCCPCLATWLAAPCFGVVCLGAPLPCVVFCGAVLLCGGVLSCSAVCLRRGLCLLFVSYRWASVVCVLVSRAVRSLSSAPCAVLCCAVLVPLCRAVHVVCAVSGAWCCWCLMSLFVLGVRWWLWLPGVVVFGDVCRPWFPCLAASPVPR